MQKINLHHCFNINLINENTHRDKTTKNLYFVKETISLLWIKIASGICLEENVTSLWLVFKNWAVFALLNCMKPDYRRFPVFINKEIRWEFKIFFRYCVIALIYKWSHIWQYFDQKTRDFPRKLKMSIISM